MSRQKREWFFGPLLDKLKNGDIPTEDTFRDLLDSVPFFRHVEDSPTKTKAGIVKSTSDDKVNNRDGSDQAGESPLGFKTFVQPQQLPKLIAGANVTLTPVVRGTPVDGDDESGKGIEDIEIALNFVPPAPAVYDADDINTTQNVSVKELQGGFPYSVATLTLNAPATLQSALNLLAQYQRALADATDFIADTLYAEQVKAVAKVEATIEPPGLWGAKYMEPNGQVLLVANYPDLFAKIGYTYGGGGATFQLPNQTSDAYLRAVKTSSVALGTMTGSDNISLVEANIPQHTHDFTGMTDTDGQHSHQIRVHEGDAGYVVVDGNGGGAAGENLTNTETDGIHSHAFSGTTDTWGANPVTPLTIAPRAFNVYLRIRVLP